MPKPLPSPHLSPKQTLLMLASIAEAAGGQMGVALNKQNVKEYVDDRDYPQIEGDDPERRRRQVAKIIPGAFALYVEIGLLDATGADKEGVSNDATRRWYALWKSDTQSAWQMFRDHLSQSWFAKTLYNRPPRDVDEAYQTLGYAAEFDHEPDDDEQNALQKAIELLIYFDLISPAEAPAEPAWDTPTGAEHTPEPYATDQPDDSQPHYELDSPTGPQHAYTSEPDDEVTSEEAPRTREDVHPRRDEKRITNELIDGSSTGAHDILDADSQQFAVSGWLNDPHNPMGTDAEPPTGTQPAFDGEPGIYYDKTVIGVPENNGGYFVDFAAAPEQAEEAPVGDEFVPSEPPRSARFWDDERPAVPPAETDYPKAPITEEYPPVEKPHSSSFWDDERPAAPPAETNYPEAPITEEYPPVKKPHSSSFWDDERPAAPPAETDNRAAASTEEAAGAKTQPTPPQRRSFAAQVNEEDASEGEEEFKPRRRRRSSSDRMMSRESSLDDILSDSTPAEEPPRRAVEPAEPPTSTETEKQAPPTFATRAAAWEDERPRHTPPSSRPAASEPGVDAPQPRRRLTPGPGAPPSDDVSGPHRRPTVGASRADDDLPTDRSRRRQRPQEPENDLPRRRPTPTPPPSDADPFDTIRRRRSGGESSPPPSSGASHRITNGPVDMRRHGPRSTSKKQQEADDATQYVSEVFGLSITAMPDGEIRLNLTDSQWKKLSDEDRATLEEAMRLVRRAVRDDNEEE
ncbi:MAG TPA: hypothetical protein VHP83_00160 [Aggregatilineaceae bacterium]|nr:hypothetical protein [Aggregatilineaceae bacterium]